MRLAGRVQKLERLESLRQLAKPALFRYGWLKPLPENFQGERHVALLKCEPTLRPFVEWCEFEERPGSGASRRYRQQLHSLHGSG